jgi:hypothetical protein
VDNGTTWQIIPIDLVTDELNFIDIDQEKIYIACQDGIAVSENLEGNFSWSFHWTWDGCSEVKMQNGYGWCVVPNYGSRSGINKKMPDSNWELVSAAKSVGVNTNKSIGIDPNDPNVVFVYNKLTTDGGVSWLSTEESIKLYTIWDNKLTAFGVFQYTNDQAKTWQMHGLRDVGVMSKGPDDLLYASASNNGIYRGAPNNWINIGLAGYNITSMTFNNQYVFASLLNYPDSEMQNNLRRSSISSTKNYR